MNVFRLKKINKQRQTCFVYTVILKTDLNLIGLSAMMHKSLISIRPGSLIIQFQ